MIWIYVPILSSRYLYGNLSSLYLRKPEGSSEIDFLPAMLDKNMGTTDLDKLMLRLERQGTGH